MKRLILLGLCLGLGVTPWAQGAPLVISHSPPMIYLMQKLESTSQVKGISFDRHGNPQTMFERDMPFPWGDMAFLGPPLAPFRDHWPQLNGVTAPENGRHAELFSDFKRQWPVDCAYLLVQHENFLLGMTPLTGEIQFRWDLSPQSQTEPGAFCPLSMPTLSIGEAFYNQKWHRLCLSVVPGKKHRLVACDLTALSQMRGAQAPILWTFEAQEHDCLGKPEIIRLENGQWVVAIIRVQRGQDQTVTMANVLLLNIKTGRQEAQVAISHTHARLTQGFPFTPLTLVDKQGIQAVQHVYFAQKTGRLWRLTVNPHTLQSSTLTLIAQIFPAEDISPLVVGSAQDAQALRVYFAVYGAPGVQARVYSIYDDFQAHRDVRIPLIDTRLKNGKLNGPHWSIDVQGHVSTPQLRNGRLCLVSKLKGSPRFQAGWVDAQKGLNLHQKVLRHSPLSPFEQTSPPIRGFSSVGVVTRPGDPGDQIVGQAPDGTLFFGQMNLENDLLGRRGVQEIRCSRMTGERQCYSKIKSY